MDFGAVALNLLLHSSVLHFFVVTLQNKNVSHKKFLIDRWKKKILTMHWTYGVSPC